MDTPFDTARLTRSMRETLPRMRVADTTGMEHLVNLFDAAWLWHGGASVLQYNADGMCFSQSRVQTLANGQRRPFKVITCVPLAETAGFYFEEGDHLSLREALANVESVVFRRRGYRRSTFLGNLRQLSAEFPQLHTVQLDGIYGQMTVDLSVSPIRVLQIRSCNEIHYVKLGPATAKATMEDCGSLELVVGTNDVHVTVYSCAELLSLVGIAHVSAAMCRKLVDIPSLNVETSMIGPGCNALRLWGLKPRTFMPLVEEQSLSSGDKAEILKRKESQLVAAFTERMRRELGTNIAMLNIRPTKSLCLLFDREHVVLCDEAVWETLYQERLRTIGAISTLTAQAEDESQLPVAAAGRFDLYIYDPEINLADDDDDPDGHIYIQPHGSNLQASRFGGDDMDMAELAASNIPLKELIEILCEPSVQGHTRLYSVRRHACDVTLIGDVPFTPELQAALGFFNARKSVLFIEKNNIITAVRLNYETFCSVQIEQCPALRLVRAGLFVQRLCVRDCPSVLLIQQPLVRTFITKAVQCGSLVGLFGIWKQIYVQDCPKLRLLQGPVSIKSGISVGPGCPSLPWPEVAMVLSQKAVFLPLLADRALSALYMQDKTLSGLSDADPNKAEFLRQVELFETSARVEDYYAPRSTIVYPQASGTYTCLSPGRAGTRPANVFVAGEYRTSRRIRTELSQIALPAVAVTLTVAKQSPSMTNSFLPRHIWHHIADFLTPSLFESHDDD
jgi:hypothetical protein